MPNEAWFLVELSCSCISVSRLAGAVVAVVVRQPMISSSTRTLPVCSWDKIEFELNWSAALDRVADGWIKFKLFGG